MPSVSVIIPLFNREDYILECVQSVLLQTHSDLQVIVVNNGSTDGGREIVAAIKDPRLEICDISTNDGWPPAVNLGMTKATGKWVYLLPSDDRIHPEMLARMIEKGEQDGSDGVYCWLRGIDERGMASEKADHEHGNLYAYTDTSHFEYRAARWNIVGCFNAILWRRSSLASCLPIPNMIVADWAVMLRSFKAKHRWTILPERLVDYRRHSDNLSETTNSTEYYIDYFYAHLTEYRPVMREQDANVAESLMECQQELVSRAFTYFPQDRDIANRIALASECGFDAPRFWPTPMDFRKWAKIPLQSDSPEHVAVQSLVQKVQSGHENRLAAANAEALAAKAKAATDRAERLRDELDRCKIKVEQLKSKLKR